MEQLEELEYYLNREYNKLRKVFETVKFIGKNQNVWKFVLSYWKDCEYFYRNGEKVKAFELVNYIWGMLDILANLNMLDIPKDIKKWFKV